MARIKVTGEYIAPNIYVLKTEDGKVFRTIKEGLPFSIGVYSRQWIPEKVARDGSKPSILMCRKYDNVGNMIDQFPLYHKKTGTWAVTEKEELAGVFHLCCDSDSKLAKVLYEVGQTEKCVKNVSIIQKENIWGNQYVVTDSDWNVDSDYIGGTYAIGYKLISTPEKSEVLKINNIFITAKADEEEVIKRIVSLKEQYQ